MEKRQFIVIIAVDPNLDQDHAQAIAALLQPEYPDVTVEERP